METTELYALSDLARKLRVSTSWLRVLIKSHGIKPIKIARKELAWGNKRTLTKPCAFYDIKNVRDVLHV